VVDVSYGGIRGLVTTASMRVCSAIAPRGVRGRGKVWHRETRCDLCIPLPIQVGRSLLRYPKIGVKPSMVVRLWKWFIGCTEGLSIVVAPIDVSLVCGLI
jgi:hypothetical protein